MRNITLIVFTTLMSCVRSETEPNDMPETLSGGSSVDVGTGGSPEAICKDGEKRACHVTLGNHEGVTSCFVGVQFCESGEWTGCSAGR